jgi:ubiquinone/menaquinone biosynthesis C-methylase UbiE
VGYAMQDQRDLVRQAFTRQAAAYARNPVVANRERIARLVRTVEPESDARVLDVATGPGYVAQAFAVVCHEVVGVDITAAPLRIADDRRREHGRANLSFCLAAVEQLPFDDEAFDIVVCRFAFHHFRQPELALAELRRVCRLNGKLALEDLIVSEHPARAAYQNQFERLRDPSHTAALSLSTFLSILTRARFEVEAVLTDDLLPDVEQWLANAQTLPAQAQAAREMIDEDRLHDRSGTRPFTDEQGHIRFHQRTALVTGRKLP